MTNWAAPASRAKHDGVPWGLRAILATAILVLSLSFLLLAISEFADSGDPSVASGFGAATGPASTGGSPTPTPAPSTTTSGGLPVVILATVTPEPTRAPRPTEAPKPTCPVYGTARERGLCFTSPPSPTPAQTGTPKPEPTMAPCLPTPIPGQWCEYGPASPRLADT